MGGARAFRWVGIPLAFAAGFLTVCAVLSRLVEPAPVGGGRIEWLREHGAAYDTLFFGSSRTVRQVMPSVFDAAMAEGGRATRSFNLAMPGMRPPEDAYVIERVLEDRTAPLRFLVVESNPLRLDIPAEDEGTARAVYWHDLPRMRALVERAFAPSNLEADGALAPAVVGEHLADLADHARHWLWNATRLGRGAELIREALAPRRRPAPRLGPQGDGFQPAPEHDGFSGSARAGYVAALAGWLPRPHALDHGDAASQAALAHKQELAARHGARLVLVAPPHLAEPFAPLPELGILFLDFTDPERYPELFAPENRADAGHLNARGALLYSRLLARALQAALERGRTP